MKREIEGEEEKKNTSETLKGLIRLTATVQSVSYLFCNKHRIKE